MSSLKDSIIKKWSDPVWSKVISHVLIVSFGSFFTLLYFFIFKVKSLKYLLYLLKSLFLSVLIIQVSDLISFFLGFVISILILKILKEKITNIDPKKIFNTAEGFGGVTFEWEWVELSGELYISENKFKYLCKKCNREMSISVDRSGLNYLLKCKCGFISEPFAHRDKSKLFWENPEKVLIDTVEVDMKAKLRTYPKSREIPNRIYLYTLPIICFLFFKIFSFLEIVEKVTHCIEKSS